MDSLVATLWLGPSFAQLPAVSVAYSIRDCVAHSRFVSMAFNAFGGYPDMRSDYAYDNIWLMGGIWTMYTAGKLLSDNLRGLDN